MATPAHTTTIAGFIVRSEDPVFVALVAVHLALGLIAVSAAASAIFSPKRKGRHVLAGTVYFWAVCALSSTAAVLIAIRGTEDFHLIPLGVGALASAWLGRAARRAQWSNNLALHLIAMSLSLTFLLTSFYVETGEQLPLWSLLPPILYWIIPSAVGLPLLAIALLVHPSIRSRS